MGALLFLFIASVLAFFAIMGLGWIFGAYGNKPLIGGKKSNKKAQKPKVTPPPNLDDYFKEGSKCLKANDYAGVIANLSKYLEYNDSSSTGHEYISYAYAKLCNYPLAIKHAEKSLELNGGRYLAHIACAICGEACSDWDNTLSWAKSAIGVGKSNAEGYYYACIAYAKKGLNNSAYDEYTKVKNIDASLARRLEELLSINDARDANASSDHSNYEPNQANSTRDHYLSVLDLSLSATQSDIKSSYRTLVKVWHPDRFAHDPKLQVMAQNKLKEINEAYEYLAG